MAKHVFFAFSLIFLTGVLCGEDLIHGVSISENGILRIGAASISVSHYDSEWKVAGQKEGVKGIPESKSGEWQLKGSFITASGKSFSFTEEVKRLSDTGISYSAELSNNEGIDTNGLSLSILLPVSQYSKTSLMAGDQTLKLPENFISQTLFAGERISRIVIPAGTRKLVLSGDFKTRLQDNRKWKSNEFALMLGFNGTENKTRKASISFKLELLPFDSHAVDISKAANMGFSDETEGDKKGGWTDQGSKNDLSPLKPGRKEFGTVAFDIIDPEKNKSRSCMVFSGPDRNYLMKEADIPIQPETSFKYLFLLHASAWTPGNGEIIGRIEPQYADGTSSIIDVKSGEDVGDWWNPHQLNNAAVVWSAENASGIVGLYLSKFKIGEKKLKSIHIAGSGKSVWGIVGITGTKDEIPLPAESPVTVYANDQWKIIEAPTDVIPGSILDFSAQLDAPAGKHGWIVAGTDGHFRFEKNPDRTIRFYGANLCFGANFLEKKEAEELASRFARLGYNSVRFHHYDGELTGGWESKNSSTLDPVRLDKLDYLFYCFKKKGIYVTIDLYTFRNFGAEEIPEYGKSARYEIKALVPVLPSAFKAWTSMVEKLMNHVNPYTGIAWKDDPALFSICPLNEDTIGSVWKKYPDTKKIYEEKFVIWIADKKLVPDREETKKRLFEKFLNEIKTRSDREITGFLRNLGVHSLLTGCNFVGWIGQTEPRSQFDYVDNHSYWNHPTFPEKDWSLPIGTNHSSAIRNFAEVPRGMMATRIFGKPFMVTEFNFVYPNRYRAESGPLMGAYSSLQDWDGLYRFAWAHNHDTAVGKAKNCTDFNIASQPMDLLSERIGILLFLRHDVNSAKTRIPFIITGKTLLERGYQSDFPVEYQKLGLVMQIGSEFENLNSHLKGQFSQITGFAPVSAETAAEMKFEPYEKLFKKFASSDDIISETGEIELRREKGILRIATELTECFVLPEGTNEKGNSLEAKAKDGFCVVSASSMDRKPLFESEKILLFHLTDVRCSKMRFRNESENVIESWGELPYLIKRGEAEISLATKNHSLKVWALDLSGNRQEKISSKLKDGKLSFTAKTVREGNKTGMIYEISEE